MQCRILHSVIFCRLWFHPDRQHCLVANTPQWERGSCLLRGEIHRCPKFHNEEEFVGVPTSHFYDFHPAHRCPFHDVSCSLVSPFPISFPFSPGLSLTLKSRWPEMILLDPTFPQEGNASMFSVSFVIIIIIIIIIMSSIIILNRSIHRTPKSHGLSAGGHKRQSTWPPACRPIPPESFPLFNRKKLLRSQNRQQGSSDCEKKQRAICSFCSSCYRGQFFSSSDNENISVLERSH